MKWVGALWSPSASAREPGHDLAPACALGAERAKRMLHTMSTHERSDIWWRSFVLEAPARTAKLAVMRADGAPHIAPVWVDIDDEDIVFLTSATTLKGKAILRDPRVSLCWDDERPPFTFVTVAGIASTSTDADQLLHWATRIAGRYMGPERAD